ncbi:MAG: hypothetical protein JXN61_17745, partial [Sedimentisphaerales bacterium]|nr:hypothetical protein [Sedimentisphaerales bacterium]
MVTNADGGGKAGCVCLRALLVASIMVSFLTQSGYGKVLFRPRELEPDPNCWYGGCWKTGDNLLIGGWAWADCNSASGYVGTIAHGSVCDGAAAEATQWVAFYVSESRYITFRAKILRQGGAVIQGAAAFGGTQKVWIIDEEHNKTDIDPPWGWSRAVSLVMDVALAVCDVSAPCKAVKDVMKNALAFNNAMGLFLSLYHAGLSERVTIEKHFYATEGWHTVAVGLRSTVSGCSWDKADALNHGIVEEMLVWGIGQPQPPQIEGPTKGCPGGYYDFTVYCDDCTGQSLDEVSYLFDWGDDDVDGPTNPVWCGKPVTRTHHWREPGDYEIQVFVQDRDDYTWSVATTHTITISQEDPNGGPDPVYATEGEYCDHIDISWKTVEGAEGYILYRDALDHPSEQPPEEGDHEIYRGPALSYSDYDIHVDPIAADTKYWVRAYSECGYVTSDSEPNENGSQPVIGYARRPCGAPTNVNVTEWVCGPLTITWDPVTEFTGFHDYGMASEYIIYRSNEDDPATADEIGRTYCTNCTEFTDEPTAGIWYYYWVRAVSDCNPDGSEFSASDAGYRRPVDARPPTNVTATDGTRCFSVRIEWDALSGHTYSVYRDGERISEPRIYDYFTDYNAVPGVLHTYTVETCNDPDCNDMCLSASDTGYVPAIPPTPMGVQATDGIPCDVVVTWQPVPGAVEYRIYRDGEQQEEVDGATTSWIDKFTSEGTIYTYQVASSNGCRRSAVSEPDTGFSSHDISRSIVANPQASDGTYCDKVYIKWTSGLPDGCWYSLWRSANSDSAAKYKIADHLTIGEYDDYTAEPGVTYRYYLKVESACSRSAFSNYNSGRVAPRVAQPAAVSASYRIDCNWIRIEWDNITDWDYYEVWRSNSEDINDAVLLISNLGTNIYDDIAAERGRDYYYWIRARYGPCLGPYSASDAVGRLADDSDMDGRCDADDNCPYAFNPGRENCCDPC